MRYAHIAFPPAGAGWCKRITFRDAPMLRLACLLIVLLAVLALDPLTRAAAPPAALATPAASNDHGGAQAAAGEPQAPSQASQPVAAEPPPSRAPSYQGSNPAVRGSRWHRLLPGMFR